MRTILLISPYWKEDHRWMVSTVNMAELWQRIGYGVHVLCMGPTDGGKRETEKISDTLTIHRVQDVFLPDPWNYGIAWKFMGRASRLANELKPDIIVVNKVLFWSSIATLTLRLTGHRVLLITDALVGITWWGRGKLFQVCSAIYAWTLGWLILLAANRVSFFHPQPQAVLKRLCISGKSQVIPTGIDPKPYGPGAERGKNGVTVTYVGRLESVKGVDDFVMVADKLKREFPAVNFRVVGWYKPGHPLVLKYANTVTFTGLRKDIPVVLGESDIFVLPSYSEGLSNALMEAMSSGCACIASEVGGNAYLIQNGVSGFLFPPGDQAALEAHIRRLLGDPHKMKALGLAARARIEQMFSWDVVGAQYAKLFDAWVGGPSA
ncbi:MAG TPA: glycosyltransferase family 4 protein [Candidatus Peribacteria bacterium]|nr:glycosyltransferase family 4 protein [Candidatus Peribacteria bacterium]